MRMYPGARWIEDKCYPEVRSRVMLGLPCETEEYAQELALKIDDKYHNKKIPPEVEFGRSW